jgi:polyisoprenoid-binding protein YceI
LVLNSRWHPRITFESTGGRVLDERRWQFDGNLTLAGTTVPVQVPVEVESGTDETRLRATVTVVQSRFGIKPYSAMMGALKVADEVEIRAEATTPASR